MWWCYPRFDGDPIFSRLVAGGEDKGFCDVLLDGIVDLFSEYIRNTAVVSTVLTDDKGGSIRIADFAPRFREYDRVFRPPHWGGSSSQSQHAAHHNSDASDWQLRRPDDASEAVAQLGG